MTRTIDIAIFAFTLLTNTFRIATGRLIMAVMKSSNMRGEMMSFSGGEGESLCAMH